MKDYIFLNDDRTFAFSAENPTGERGGGSRGGDCTKISPTVTIHAGETVTLAEIDGSGLIQSMWFTGYVGHSFILRIYWNGQAHPSVEAPLSAFFGSAYDENFMDREGRYPVLDSAIAAQKVNKKDYTKSSYKTLQKTISAANKVIADPDASAEDLREANVTVLEAQKDLEKKSANTMTVKTTKKTVKYKKVKKAKKVVKAITVKKAVGKVTYAKKSGSKYLSVNKKTGKVTVKKGTKKGKHTMKVTVKAAGNDNVKAATKTVSVVIIVK